MVMQTQFIQFGKNRFVVVPEKQYNELLRKASDQASDDDLLPMPPRDANGMWPAIATVRASIARTIQSSRKAKGWTQAELAKAAGVRVETINRLEKGKHSADVRTVVKIEKALARP